jgi:DNA primase
MNTRQFTISVEPRFHKAIRARSTKIRKFITHRNYISSDNRSSKFPYEQPMPINSYQKKSLDDSVKEEIRSIINIADVVGRHVALKPAGQNLKGLCPFHKEKTPSFTVSPAKGIYYCFGCHKGGDVYNFLMELEGLTFPEALQQLADEAGVRLAPRTDRQEPGPAPESAESGAADEGSGISKAELLSINQLALEFFYQSTRSCKPAIDYFLSRGLTRETIRDFKLGYAPDGWTSFLDFAKSKGVPGSSVAQAGLAIVKPETGRVYDRFRGRIMFPIFDTSKRPVGFAGRGMSPEATPKYLNSPETPLYQKSKILYGFHVTQQHIRESKSAIIVEGYMDFLSLYQAGVKNVIASSGTAFTDAHARTLRRFTQKIFLVFDGDAAGIEAAHRAIIVLAPYNFDIGVLTIPDDEDPDDYVKKNGAKGFSDLLKSAQDYIAFIVGKTARDYESSSPMGKSRTLDALVPLVQSFTDSIVRERFYKEISETLSIGRDIINKRIRGTVTAQSSSSRNNDGTIRDYFGTIEGNFIRILLTNPDLIKDARQFILPETFSDHFSSELYSYILTSHDEDASLATLIGRIQSDETKRIISFAYALDPAEGNAREEMIHTIGRLQAKYLEKQKRAITERLKKEPQNRTVLLEKLKEYTTQLKALFDI